MNIKTIIDHLRAIPVLQPVITNTVTVSIAGTMLEIVFPDIPPLKEYVKRHEKPLRTELSGAFALDMRYTFAPYAMPFLPFPAGSSKHGNYILFLFPQKEDFSYGLIRKTNLFAVIEKNEPCVSVSREQTGHALSLSEQHALIENIFVTMQDTLREQWSYLHPVFTFTDIETLQAQKKLIEDVFRTIETNRGISDIRRFIGVPCFSFIDYQKFIENA